MVDWYASCFGLCLFVFTFDCVLLLLKGLGFDCRFCFVILVTMFCLIVVGLGCCLLFANWWYLLDCFVVGIVLLDLLWYGLLLVIVFILAVLMFARTICCVWCGVYHWWLFLGCLFGFLFGLLWYLVMVVYLFASEFDFTMLCWLMFAACWVWVIRGCLLVYVFCFRGLLCCYFVFESVTAVALD